MTIDRRETLGLIASGLLVVPQGAGAFAVASPCDLMADDLTVEWMARPVGIDERRPRFAWRLTPTDLAARGVRQTAWQVVVGHDRPAVGAGRGDVWDSGPIGEDAQRIRPPRPLRLATHRRYWWAVRVADGTGRWSQWGEPADFVTGVLSAAEWPVRWIAAAADRPLPPHFPGQVAPDSLPACPLPVMRRQFSLRGAPRRAFVSVCGLGQYRLAINGAAVGHAALAPGWTNYRRRVLYDTYDVAGLVRPGENVLAMMLGNGMYNVEHRAGRYTKFLDSFGAPKAILLLTIEHADGRVERITSDDGWRWRDGPIAFSSIYGGEDWDARSISPDWDRPGFDDRDWHKVIAVDGPGGTLRTASIPPVVVAQRLTPASITESAPGVILVDFGRNFAGRPAIELAAAAGATLVALPGEALDAQGRVNQSSFNAGPGNAVEFRYTAAGRGIERFGPLFTYHGFRYLEISGVPGTALRRIEGLVLHADIARVGAFDAGPPLLGQIHRLIDAAVTSNMMSVLTDCPHREKLGWLEQTYLNAPTVLYNRDAITLYEKLVDDMAEGQQSDGMVPGIAPEYVAFVDAAGRDQIWRNSPEWGAAAILAPWSAYRFYGDATILQAAWPAAVRYCAYLDRRTVDGIIDFGMGDWYDAGPKEPGEAQLTNRALTGTAIHIEALQTMARIAPLIGKDNAAEGYRRQASAVAARFNARFLDAATGRYERGSQTAQAMPLALGIVPGSLRPQVLSRLIEAVRREGNGTTAGDIGFRYVIAALAEAGRDDVVLDMLEVRDRPGYAWQIAHGATALTEAWDANPTKSLNHFMLGHAEGWLYGRLAGIDIDHAREAGEALRIAPRVLPGVGSARASRQLRGGMLSAAWRVAGGVLQLDVDIPAGRRATVIVPTRDPVTLREGRRPAAAVRGVVSMRTGPDGAILVVGSGRYRFFASAAV